MVEAVLGRCQRDALCGVSLQGHSDKTMGLIAHVVYCVEADG